MVNRMPASRVLAAVRHRAVWRRAPGGACSHSATDALVRGAAQTAARHVTAASTMQMSVLFMGLRMADAPFIPRPQPSPSVS